VVKILGIEGKRFILRLIYVIIIIAINIGIWYYIPKISYEALGIITTELEYTYLFYAGLIASLSAIGILFKERIFGKIAPALASLVSAYYLLIITNFGFLRFTQNLKEVVVNIEIEFRLIVLLFLASILFGFIGNILKIIHESATKKLVEEEIVEV
jgi:hypothetical protein